MRFLTFALLLFAMTAGLLKADDTSALPIKVTFRESLLFHGTFVAQFRNEGDRNLLLHVEFDRPDNSARRTLTLLVQANGFKEVGRNQGWIVKSGDEIAIRCNGYSDMQTQMP